jgi:hypothetical protein
VLVPSDFQTDKFVRVEIDVATGKQMFTAIRLGIFGAYSSALGGFCLPKTASLQHGETENNGRRREGVYRQKSLM